MKKPGKRTKEYYDYHECRDYLQEKYSYDERDYAGKHNHGKAAKNSKAVTALGLTNDNDPPYWDFWHFVIDAGGVQSNSSFFHLTTEWLHGETEDWQKEIIQHYLDEFADKDGMIEFYVDW